MSDDNQDKVRAIHLAAAKLQADESLRRFLSPPLADSLLELMRSPTPGSVLDRVADLAKLIAVASSEPPDCSDHRLRQHRDHKPPWCRTCRRTRWGASIDEIGGIR